jgi:hypothetical protein
MAQIRKEIGPHASSIIWGEWCVGIGIWFVSGIEVRLRVDDIADEANLTYLFDDISMRSVVPETISRKPVKWKVKMTNRLGQNVLRSPVAGIDRYLSPCCGTHHPAPCGPRRPRRSCAECPMQQSLHLSSSPFRRLNRRPYWGWKKSHLDRSGLSRSDEARC